MSNTSQRILDEVAATAVQLLLREPFYAHLLGALSKEVVRKGHPVDTLAVGANRRGDHFTLYINADFWDKDLKNPDYRLGVLKHEMLHLVFRHLLIDVQAMDYLLLNVAFDLVVNQYVERRMLPDDSIFLESFPELSLLPGQTWFYYYRKIQETQRSGGSGKPGESGRESLEQIKSDTNGLERHQPWQELRARSELEKDLLEHHLDSLLQTAHQRTSAHAWGNMPGEVRERIQEMQQRSSPTLDWRSTLRLFSGSASRTYLKNTIKRPSRRFGTVPGIRIRRKPKFLVGIDTSGSIGQLELSRFFDEVFHLWRAGAEIEVLECDTVITRRYPYRGQTPEAVEGRGGTNFKPVLEIADQERPDALLYLTDGYAEPPGIQPRLPVLWLISPRGLESSHPHWALLPGRKVKMGL
ncbi:MAG: hypothetical protein J0L99_01025 [Chitinophagales bacterium]|nr:hypothetical protein [Chitinophagales bacterium]